MYDCISLETDVSIYPQDYRDDYWGTTEFERYMFGLDDEDE